MVSSIRQKWIANINKRVELSCAFIVISSFRQYFIKHYYSLFQSMRAPDLKEKLEESEKLIQEISQTWEEKLRKTELVHKVKY